MRAAVLALVLPSMLVARVALADQAPVPAKPVADPAPVAPPTAETAPPPKAAEAATVAAPQAPAEPAAPVQPAVPVQTLAPVVAVPAQPQNDNAQLAATGLVGPHERQTTWDLNLDGAYGRMFGDSPEWTGFGRVRVGVLHIRDTMYFMLGGTYEISDRIAATFGIQGEAMHLSSGLWVQVGALLDIRPRPGFMGAVGWSLFGIEAQQRNDEQFGSVVSVYGKIRVPVRIIAKAFEKK